MKISEVRGNRCEVIGIKSEVIGEVIKRSGEVIGKNVKLYEQKGLTSPLLPLFFRVYIICD